MNKLQCISLSLKDNVIEKIEQYLTTNFADYKFNKVCIIFAGKRPTLILKKHLAERIKNDYIPPATFSIEEFVHFIISQYSSSAYISDIDAVYLLFKVVKKIPYFKKRFKKFVEFIPWGYEIYNFIEQLKMENIDKKSLINITKTAEYEKISLTKELISHVVYIETEFYNKLKDINKITRGLAYKMCVEYLKNTKLEQFDEIIFVTPFYLHQVELELLSTLSEKNKLVLIIQGNPNNWKQLRKLVDRLKINIQFENDELTFTNIYFYSFFDKHSEICCLHNILKNFSENELNNTLIVLPDDETATVLLSALPENVKEFNLVCGYPLKHSVVYSLIDKLFLLQTSKKNELYYTKHYVDLLSNPIVKELPLHNDTEVIRNIIDTIQLILIGKIKDQNLSKRNFIDINILQNSNSLYENIIASLLSIGKTVTKEEIVNIINNLHELLLFQWEKIETVKDCCDCFKNLLNLILQNSDKVELNLEIFKTLYTIIENFEHSLFAKQKFNKEEIFKLFLDEIGKTKLSFSGSPVRGLQILGFFETRNLTYDNLIILDLNEGILPYIKTKSVLIPRDILIKLGIDRIEIEEEIQKYHFIRLLSSAKNIYILYVESNETERSRFVEQLIWQLQKKNNSINLNNLTKCYFKVNLTVSRPEVEKNDEIVKHLKNFMYSTTAIDTYLTCPLKFYYKFVLSLEEIDISFEEPESKEIGTFIHELLKETFSKFQNKKPEIDEHFVQNFFKIFEHKFEQSMSKLYKSEAYLVKEVMKFHLKRFLDSEKQRIQKYAVEEIVLLETPFVEQIILKDNIINFRCVIDRVDKLNNGSLLVIDYKTGDVKTPVKNLEGIEFSREVIKKKIKSFQLPLYTYIIEKKFNAKNKVNAMLYNIKEPDNFRFLFSTDNTSFELTLQKFLELLNFIINEILNIQIPFYADDTDSYTCDNCNFGYLCR